MTFLTGAGQRDRFLHQARTVETVDERVSLTAVVEAISDIMGDHNRGGVIDRALASRIGGQVQVAVADAVGTGRISSTTQLIGQQAFWNILSQHLASTSSAYTDQEARQNFLHYMRNNANRTSADFANFVAQFRRGGGYGGRDRDGGLGGDRGTGSSLLLTGARFDDLDFSNDPAMAGVLGDADRCGLGWLRHSRELLQLGPAAIAVLVATQFRRESFSRMTDAGFTTREVVGLARYARDRNLDANNLAGAAADIVTGLAPNDPQEQERLRRLMNGHFENSNDAEARRALVEELRRQRERGPDQAGIVDNFGRASGLQADINGANTAVTNGGAQIAVAQEQTNTDIDALNGPAPAAQKPPGQQPTLHVAGPR